MTQKSPFACALIILGWTLAIIVVVFMVGGIATAVIFGDSDEAYWGLALCFMLFAPIAFLTGLALAFKRFARERRARKIQKATNVSSP